MTRFIDLVNFTYQKNLVIYIQIFHQKMTPIYYYCLQLNEKWTSTTTVMQMSRAHCSLGIIRLKDYLQVTMPIHYFTTLKSIEFNNYLPMESNPKLNIIYNKITVCCDKLQRHPGPSYLSFYIQHKNSKQL